MGRVHVTVSDAGGRSDKSMPPAEVGRGAITHQSLLHCQLLSASHRLSHAIADMTMQKTWSVLLNTQLA